MDESNETDSEKVEQLLTEEAEQKIERYKKTGLIFQFVGDLDDVDTVVENHLQPERTVDLTQEFEEYLDGVDTYYRGFDALDEDSQGSLAMTLKGQFEYGATVVVSASEGNGELLTHRNSDLRGRVRTVCVGGAEKYIPK